MPRVEDRTELGISLSDRGIFPILGNHEISKMTGMSLVTIGVAAQVIGALILFPASEEEQPTLWLLIPGWTLIIGSLFPYLLGYRRALREKNYPSVLYLAAFTGLLGTALIFLLPDKSQNNCDPRS